MSCTRLVLSSQTTEKISLDLDERNSSAFHCVKNMVFAGQNASTLTGLRPPSALGPGVEFLQYLTPGGGRATPPDARANDLVATHTVIEVDDFDALASKLQSANVVFVSPRIVEVAGQPYRRQLMVRDPDGHPVLLVQP